MDSIMSIIIFILMFGIIVLVHEYGHFLLARVNGITVVEFAIGMGPTLYSFTRKGTKYSLKLLPIGGACMFEGEDGVESGKTPSLKEKTQIPAEHTEEIVLQKDTKRTGAFPEANVWARISTVVAGPVFNIILAFVFAMIMLSFTTSMKPVITDTMEGYPAREAGLQGGDVITKINGHRVYIYQEVSLDMALNFEGEPVEITYKRDGKTYETTIIPKFDEEAGRYYIGIKSDARFQPKGLELIPYAFYEVRYCVNYTFKSLGMLISGQAGIKDMSGPVGVAQVVDETYTEAKAYGWETVAASMLNLCILLSVNLGILNLLPIPALDGGRLLFLIIELIRRKPIPPEKEGIVHFAGFVALMILMVVVFFNDIMRLIH